MIFPLMLLFSVALAENLLFLQSKGSAVKFMSNLLEYPASGKDESVDLSRQAANTQKIICEGFRDTLVCPSGVIRVLSANYGRTDATTCPHPSIQTNSCYLNQLDYVKSRCEGKTSCTISSDNTFGDPCVNTYKYLNVRFYCQSPPATCQCGGPFTNRIVGGAVVTPHSRPFQALVILNNTGLCGGTLISPNFVLTAAHCTLGLNPSNIRVIVGDHNINMSGDGEQFFNVVSSIIHPNYQPGPDTLWANDYSLLQLVRPISLPSPVLGLACLPPDTTQTFSESTLIASGWGLTQGGGQISYELKAAKLVGLSNSVCRNTFPNIGNSHICALGAPTNTTCQGDSGGPLTAVVDGKVTVVGSTSFGVINCPTAYPPVFARVTDAKNWILSNTDAGGYQCSGTQKIICEGFSDTLVCSSGVIRILSANYGRTDAATCPHPSIQTASCFLDQSTYVKSKCEGKTSCTFTSDNSFGDPCVNTYKYLDVHFNCQ